MPFFCQRCHKAFVQHSSLESRICTSCATALSKQNLPSDERYSYEGNIRPHHQIHVKRAADRLQRQNTFQQARNQQQIAGPPAMTRASSFSSSSSTSSSSSSSSVANTPTNILQVKCRVLFIPFDAGNNFYHQNARSGTFQAKLVPEPKNHFKSLHDHESDSMSSSSSLATLNNKVLPHHSEFERPSSSMPDTDILKSYDQIVWKHIAHCTDISALEWLSPNSPQLTLHLMDTAPEIIFLSEELTHAPFPEWLKPHPKIRYRKLGSIKGLVSDGRDVDAKNEIAAYALYDESRMVHVLYDVRVLKRPGPKHEEKWLCVKKILLEYKVYIEVAGVHLDAGYTGYTGGNKKRAALEEVANFAIEEGVDALLGDCNMDTFELKGGMFPNSRGFESTSKGIVPAYTFSHSNTNGKNNYMGGLIVNGQVHTESTGVKGEQTMSLTRTLDDKFYSDHPAIVANYVKSFT